MTFTTQSMQDIIPILQEALKKDDKISFNVLNPDDFHAYAGEEIDLEETKYIYRGYKAWADLAELLKAKMLTPQRYCDTLVTLCFQKLEEDSFHESKSKDKVEKYGISSHFSRLNKMEEPAFLYYYTQALKNIKIHQRKRLLNLGINRGDEFKIIENMLEKNNNIEMIGIDHSQTAIDYAKESFKESKKIGFYAQDINTLEALKLGRFDVLISIGTLQSPSLNFKPFLMSLVQDHLEKDSALILGFPNSRWQGGEILYGAKAPNYAMSEMSLLYNDVIFAKKYLQQHKYRVTLTGKYYVFLTATKIGV